VVENFQHVLGRRFNDREYEYYSRRLGEISPEYFMELYERDEFRDLLDREGIEDSPKKFVRLLMIIFIGREPTDADYDHHGSRLDRGEINRVDLAREFATCPEFNQNYERARGGGGGGEQSFEVGPIMNNDKVPLRPFIRAGWDRLVGTLKRPPALHILVQFLPGPWPKAATFFQFLSTLGSYV